MSDPGYLYKHFWAKDMDGEECGTSYQLNAIVHLEEATVPLPNTYRMEIYIQAGHVNTNATQNCLQLPKGEPTRHGGSHTFNPINHRATAGGRVSGQPG